eukprot:TRINITY_DN4361_c0_g1_i3.p2 TRINITY_DN4361_c0_g1~~TRINITY_DN4361_c0_g1_i3.p2  ORF type:complete len:169 (-),score=34.93 TRINITY_DN4361_c0_g1_i3:22-528(-)
MPGFVTQSVSSGSHVLRYAALCYNSCLLQCSDFGFVVTTTGFTFGVMLWIALGAKLRTLMVTAVAAVLCVIGIHINKTVTWRWQHHTAVILRFATQVVALAQLSMAGPWCIIGAAAASVINVLVFGVGIFDQINSGHKPKMHVLLLSVPVYVGGCCALWYLAPVQSTV